MIELPKVCPSCGEAVEQFTDPKSKILSLWCLNTMCPGRVTEDLVAVSHRDVLELESLGPDLAGKLAKEGWVLSLADLFEFIRDYQRSLAKDQERAEAKLKQAGFSVAAVTKLAESSHQAKTRDWDRWIVALNIEGIGKVIGKTLAQVLELDDIGSLCDRLLLLPTLTIEGLGGKKVQAVVDWAKDPVNRDMCSRLQDLGIHPANPFLVKLSDGPQPLTGMVICVTGEHGIDREEIHKYLAQLGATVKTGVTKKLTHLLAGVGAGRSKLSKADELGIIKLNREWLHKTLKANGIVIKEENFEMDVEI